MFNLDSEYPHIRNASEKKTQMLHFWSQEQPKLTTDSSHTNEPISCASDTAPDPRIDNDANDAAINQCGMMRSQKMILIARMNECIFLPKFHCELNPIEMVSPNFPH